MNQRSNSTAQKPQALSGDIFASGQKIVNDFLNWIFALRHGAAMTRNSVLTLLFIGAWVLMAVNIAGFQKLGELLFNILVKTREGDPTGTLNNFTTAIFATFLHPVVLRHLIILVTPFLLMHRAAATYLADIFERDREVAEKFIIQAAFGTGYNVIHVREGKIIEADLNSPLVLIGGPGRVVVELDSAVLFELPDGKPNLIGPTNNISGSKVIFGFERLRATFDLRDVIDEQTVVARSMDGIPVTARDIQYSYSIYRGPNPVKNLKTPYPFDQESALNLAYKSPKPVKLDETRVYKPDWNNPLPGKIVGAISGDVVSFVSKKGLSQFLASTGAPENDRPDTREKNNDLESPPLSELNGASSGSNPRETQDKFTTRPEMTAELYKNSKERAEKKKGVYLNWIGVGTWATPPEIIPDRHLEAWKISRNNLARGSEEEFARLRNEAKLQELTRQVQTLPISNVNIEGKPSINPGKIDRLIREYLFRLENARDLYIRDKLIVPEGISQAIIVLQNILASPNS